MCYLQASERKVLPSRWLLVGCTHNPKHRWNSSGGRQANQTVQNIQRNSTIRKPRPDAEDCEYRTTHAEDLLASKQVRQPGKAQQERAAGETGRGGDPGDFDGGHIEISADESREHRRGAGDEGIHADGHGGDEDEEDFLEVVLEAFRAFAEGFGFLAHGVCWETDNLA